MKKTIKIGLCGLGTVGSGVLRLFMENASIINRRVGADIKIVRAATIDPYDHLEKDLSGVQISDSVDDILTDPEIDIVVEMIGGLTLAKRIILEAFNKQKAVVTANKALLAECSHEIFEAAYKSDSHLGFEASVGGGIPIIRSIKEGLSGDEFSEISGIMNGTANFILSSMMDDNIDFQTALKEAQNAGYAESDPTFDIEGIDAAHKLLILMELAYNCLFDFKQLYIEGITGIEPIDIEIAKEFQYTIKLLGIARNTKNGFEGRVHPVLVKKDSMLASVNGVFNAISVYGNFIGHTLSYGSGAGSYPTASAVAGDIIEISRCLLNGVKYPVQPLSVGGERLSKKEILPIDGIESEYFLRFGVSDAGKALDSIRTLFEDQEVKINLIDQRSIRNQGDDIKQVIIFTRQCVEKGIQEAAKLVNTLPDVIQPAKLIRIYSDK